MADRDPEYVRKLPLAFIDCETGGLNPATDALLSVAGVITDGAGSTVLSSFNVKVLPALGTIVSPEAAAINGYTPEAWAAAGAVNELDALPKVFDAVRSTVWVGQNPRFDIDFLTAAFLRHGQKLPLGWRYPIDTAVLAWPLLKAGLISDVKLATIAKALGFEQKVPHDAFDDVMLTFQIYRRLISGYIVSVLPRDADGERLRVGLIGEAK